MGSRHRATPCASGLRPFRAYVVVQVYCSIVSRFKINQPECARDK